MRKQVAWASAALAIAIVAGLSGSAKACHPFACNWYFPYGNAYYGCAASYQACVVGYPACGPVGCCPYVGCRGYNCGYRPYGYGCGGCVAHHCAIHRARKYGLYGYGWCGLGGCGGGCFDGCGGCSGGCVSGGCASGDCASTGNYVTPRGNVDLPADANIISDRTIGNDDSAPAMADDQSAAINRSVFRLTGLKQEDSQGAPAFERGLAAYRGGSKNDALNAFTTASEAEPSNAVYHYYRALAMFDVAGAEAAQDALAEAVDLEKREGVKNWGKQMERVQGRSRVWVEKARREAGLVR